jgi:hypothetical protein
MSNEAVIIALKTDSQAEFCVVANTRDSKQFELSKTPRDSDLYNRGRFWVKVVSDFGGTSEFYNDAELAMKALTDRGVVEFKTCPKPMGID